MSSHSFAEAQRHGTVSAAECRAMRALDDGDYARREIAFIFETRVRTVSHHADGGCVHDGVAIDCEPAAADFLDSVGVADD
jgi:hypothetical protein